MSSGEKYKKIGFKNKSNQLQKRETCAKTGLDHTEGRKETKNDDYNCIF